MALKAPFRKTVRFWAGVAESPDDMNKAIRSPKASPDGSNARVELILPRRASSAHSRAFVVTSERDQWARKALLHGSRSSCGGLSAMEATTGTERYEVYSEHPADCTSAGLNTPPGAAI